MADEAPNNYSMNLDWDLGPGSMPEDDLISLDEWMDNPSSIREAVEAARCTDIQPQRWRNSEEDLSEIENILGISRFETGVGHRGQQGGLGTGDGSVGVEGQASEVEKARENKEDDKVGVEVDVGMLLGGEAEDIGKGSGDDGSFYDCNICFEMARDPVITCCGHLYCWPCIYRWLHGHSDAQECPVCKGEVMTENLTPLYGRGQRNLAQEEDLNVRVPPRPSAKRMESAQRSTWATRMEEMLRRLGTRDMQTAAAIPHDVNPANLPNPGRTTLSPRMSTRGWRREQILVPQETIAADFVESHYGSRHHLRLDGRGVANRPVSATSPYSFSTRALDRGWEMEEFTRRHRDSLPGNAVAVEIVDLESYADSGDSRPPRRRRRN
uniref:E3 ubiquitin-protein ligase RMA n=1 Tax=Kalanchoe fedtschenkoi TaxID=63787 RepID=A0A7N0UDL4_KALFE